MFYLSELVFSFFAISCTIHISSSCGIIAHVPNVDYLFLVLEFLYHVVLVLVNMNLSVFHLMSLNPLYNIFAPSLKFSNADGCVSIVFISVLTVPYLCLLSVFFIKFMLKFFISWFRI